MTLVSVLDTFTIYLERLECRVYLKYSSLYDCFLSTRKTDHFVVIWKSWESLEQGDYFIVLSSH